MTVGEKPGKAVSANEQAGSSTDKYFDKLGLKARTLTPELAERMEIEYMAGVVVLEVAPNSPARMAEIRPGHIILKVQSKPVKTVEGLARLIRKFASEGGVRLRLYYPTRGGGGRYDSLYLRIPETLRKDQGSVPD